MSGWESFLVAQVGASAALAGLVFVGVSINLERILSFDGLSQRAAVARTVLALVLIVCTMLLTPEQRTSFARVETLVAGLFGWVAVTTAITRAWRATEPQYRRQFALHVAMAQAATLPFVIAGVVFCYIEALVNAWVLLIEIKR